MTSKWLFVIAGAGLSASALAAEIDIETYWSIDADNRFSVLADGKEVCSFHGRAVDANTPLAGHCRFTLPDKAKHLRVRGDYTDAWWDGETRKTGHGKGEREFVLRDASPLAAPLRDASASLADRWHRAAAAEKKFVAGTQSMAQIDFGKPQQKAQLDAAEKRLGFSLPADYRSLLTEMGPVRFGDNGVADAEALATAYNVILKQWGYGDDGAPKWISADAVKVLQHSTMLFFEVGDGVGAELYVPPPNAACGARPGYLWLHEETLADDMHALAAGKLDCKPFADILRDFHARYVITELAETAMQEDGALLLDSGAARIELRLNYTANPEGRFEVELGVE